MLRKLSALIAIMSIGGVVLAGCGSSSSNPPATTKPVAARQTPLMSSPDTGGTRQQSAHPKAALGQLPPGRSRPGARGGKAHLATAKVLKARQTPSVSSDDVSSTGAKALNPCTLVSLTQAQSITSGAITKMDEAPLGPTCIYSGTRRSAGITLALEAENFSQVTRHLSARQHLIIGGHQSLCGRLGTQMLFVPLSRAQLLNVTAPCGIAQRFATVALSRLSA